MDNSQAKTVEDFRGQQARRDAVDRLQAAVNHLQRSTYELEIYIERIKSAQDDKQRSDVMSWAISYITCNPDESGWVFCFKALSYNIQ